MVKIIEKTSEEKTFEKKVEKLIDIAKKFDLYPTIKDRFAIGFNDGVIVIVPDQNFIGVNNSTYFNKAFKLAEAYETQYIGEEWKLKKNYDN